MNRAVVQIDDYLTKWDVCPGTKGFDGASQIDVIKVGLKLSELVNDAVSRGLHDLSLLTYSVQSLEGRNRIKISYTTGREGIKKL